MNKNSIPQGAVHTVPEDLTAILNATAVLAVWGDITPLARNEWICWVISAKKGETRNRRIAIMLQKRAGGERRPCCWAGCPHREG